MRFRIEQRFAASVAELEAAFSDANFLDRLSELPKLGRPRLIRQEVDGRQVRQWVQYRFTGDLNAAVRRVVDPDRLTWVEESTLDRSSHTTTWRIVPDHYPGMIRCSGTSVLEAEPGGTTRRVTEGDMRVNVPLVGSKVERAIVSGLHEHASAEEEVMAGWLRDRGATDSDVGGPTSDAP